jgi:hypothetical protein
MPGVDTLGPCLNLGTTALVSTLKASSFVRLPGGDRTLLWLNSTGPAYPLDLPNQLFEVCPTIVTLRARLHDHARR